MTCAEKVEEKGRKGKEKGGCPDFLSSKKERWFCWSFCGEMVGCGDEFVSAL